MVGDCQGAVDNANFQNRWTPPGTASGIRYHSLLKGVDTGGGLDKQSNEPRVWIRLDFVIQEVLDEIPSDKETDVVGRDYSVFFSTGEKSVWRMQEFLTLCDMITDKQEFLRSRDILAAAEAIEEFAGKVLVRQCNKTTISKNGKEYTNESFEDVVDSL